MAVSCTNSPGTLVSTHDVVRYCLTISDIGSGNIEKSIAYRLVDGAGNAITATEMIRPSIAGTDICIDVQDDIKGLVKTMIPQIDVAGVQNDVFLTANIRLFYGEVVKDLNACTTTVVMNSSSPVSAIINGMTQEYEQKFIGVTRFLSHQPRWVYQNRAARNYVWVFGGTGLIRYTDDVGNTTLLNVQFPNSIVPLHNHAVLPNPTAQWLKVEFLGLGQEYLMVLEDASCNGGKNYQNIMFLDPLGGRSCMSFEDVTAFEITTSQGEIDIYRSIDKVPSNAADNDNRKTTAGRTIYDKKAREKLTLTTTTISNIENAEWFKAFLASAGYHIQVVINNQVEWRKFILDAGNVKYHDNNELIEMTVSGYLAHDMRSHRVDR